MKARQLIKHLLNFSADNPDAEVYLVEDGKLRQPILDIVSPYDSDRSYVEWNPEDLGDEEVLLIFAGDDDESEEAGDDDY